MRRNMVRMMVAGVVGTMLLLGTALQAQVLNQVPADAVLVIKIKNLQETSGKIAALAQELGLAQMQPMLADPLGAIQGMGNLQAGIDKAGEAAMAMMMPPQDNRPPLIVVLVPVSDYKAFVGNFAGAIAEGDLTNVTLPNNQPAFVANWGNFAAISPEKAMLAQKPQGLKVQGMAAREMAGKDIVAYGNMQVLRAKVLPMFQQGRAQMLQQFEREMTQAPAAQQKYAPIAKAALNQLLNGVEEFLKDAQSATLGLNLNKGGIATTLMTEFEPTSYLGQLAAQMKGSDQSLTAGLPEGKYLLFGGISIDPKVLTTIIDDAVGPVLKELVAAGEDTKPALDMIDALKAMTSAGRSQSFGMVAPAGAIGQEGLFQSVTVATGDAKTMAAAQRKMFDSQEALMKLISGKAGGDAAAPVKTSFTANAKTIDGVAFDQFQTQFNMAGNTPQEMQAAQMVTWIYGPGGLNAYAGAVDPQHFVIVAGGNDALMSKTVAAVKAQSDALATLGPVQTVSSQLPKTRLAALYVPVDALVATGVNIAKTFGMPVGLQLPENLPPIGMTFGAEGSALRADGYIPTQLVQSLIAAAQQMMLQRMQAPPGGPGGL